jgi:hypothetical protein
VKISCVLVKNAVLHENVMCNMAQGLFLRIIALFMAQGLFVLKIDSDMAQGLF